MRVGTYIKHCYKLHLNRRYKDIIEIGETLNLTFFLILLRNDKFFFLLNKTCGHIKKII